MIANLQARSKAGRPGTPGRLIAGVLGCALSAACLGQVTEGGTPPATSAGLGRSPTTTNETLLPPFHFGVSARLFRGVNENDAKAALKVYMDVLGRNYGLSVPLPTLLESTEAMARALDTGAVDALTATTAEYVVIREHAGSVHVFGDPAQLGQAYAVLVHRDSPVQNLAGLRGTDLLFFDNSRTCMADRWLDVALAREGLPPLNEFFARLILERKTSAVVLPVFFQKTGACLVTRAGFDTMNELNPQVGRNLRVLAASPPLAPVVMCFAPHVDAVTRGKALDGTSRMHESVMGQQLLTIFQAGERLVEYPESSLQPTYDLIAEHERLRPPGASRRDGKPDNRSTAAKP